MNERRANGAPNEVFRSEGKGILLVKAGETKSLLGPFQRRRQIIGVSVEVIQLTDKVTGARYSDPEP